MSLDLVAAPAIVLQRQPHYYIVDVVVGVLVTVVVWSWILGLLRIPHAARADGRGYRTTVLYGD